LRVTDSIIETVAAHRLTHPTAASSQRIQRARVIHRSISSGRGLMGDVILQAGYRAERGVASDGSDGGRGGRRRNAALRPREASVGHGHRAQSIGDRLGESARRESPGPIAVRLPRCIHAAASVEPEDVLYGSDGEVSDGHLNRADEVPVDLRAVDPEIPEAVLPLPAFGVTRGFARAVLEPSEDSVVVVGPGARDDVAGILVGQMHVVRLAVEGELKDAHAGEAELVTQAVDVRRDQPQVLRDHGELTHAEPSLDRSKQLAARRLYPAAMLG